MKLVSVVGDVHGSFEEMEDIVHISKSIDKNIEMYFLGDLVDRGPYSAECVKYVRKNKFKCVLGNHEDKNIRYWNYEKARKETGAINPMKKMSTHDAIENAKLSEEDIQWMSRLPCTMKLSNKFRIVHAGYMPSTSEEKQARNVLIRLRYVKNGKPATLKKDFTAPEGSTFWAQHHNQPFHVIYGHNVNEDYKIRIDKGEYNAYGIDTGCVFGGFLTSMIIDIDKEQIVDLIQVPARKVYYRKEIENE